MTASHSPAGLTRRTVLGAAGAGALLVPDTRLAHAHPLRQDPFSLGVASGDPLATAVVLWTRLVRDPFDATSLPARDVEVSWQVATDPRFRRVVRVAVARARVRAGHSVHVDVRGLRPGTEYWYRFRARRWLSPVGRTLTLPRVGVPTGRVRLAVASCQDLQNGYWPAYAALADEDVDLVLHLGDYVYEYDASSAFADRRHVMVDTAGLDQLRTLADYRARHAQYRLDPALQAAHARAPWMLVWDDHEVENNYAGLLDEIDDTGARFQDPAAFAAQRAAGYRAYWEHLPLRPRPARDGSLRLYRGVDVGDLVRISLLDTRQYRTDQPGGFPSDFGAEAAGSADPAGTLTGAEQEAWLLDRLRTSPARWDVVAQQVMMSRTRFPNPLPGVPLPYLTNLDQWDGYAVQRRRLLEAVAAAGTANPVVLAGDIHSTWMNDLVADPDDPHAPVVASEFVTTSISSDFPVAFDAPIKASLGVLNPRTRYFDGLNRGYLLCDVTPERWLTEVRSVATIATPTAPVTTTAAFAVEAGAPGVVPA